MLNSAFQMTEKEKAVVEELKTGVQKCKICKVGMVGPVARSKEKADLVIYGINGTRLARHIESRCRVYGCRAGYFHGYMTYKGYTIYEDTTLQVSIHYCNLLQGWYGIHNSVTKRLSSGYRVSHQQPDCLQH